MTKIVFFGTPKFSAIILNKLIENNYKPSLVITAPDKPVGRESKSAPSPVKIVAKNNNIPVKTYGSLRGRDDVEEEIKKYQPDLIIVAAYGKNYSSKYSRYSQNLSNQCPWFYPAKT